MSVERAHGTVISFDETVGLGEIAADGGQYLFHCTAIADGSRLIGVGAEVEFVIVPGHGGRYEAAQITIKFARHQSPNFVKA